MGTNEYSQPASKSSWDSQDFGDVKMVLKMAHFHKSSRPQWVKCWWSILVQVMVWHCQCWPRSMLPCDVTCHNKLMPQHCPKKLCWFLKFINSDGNSTCRNHNLTRHHSGLFFFKLIVNLLGNSFFHAVAQLVFFDGLSLVDHHTHELYFQNRGWPVAAHRSTAHKGPSWSMPGKNRAHIIFMPPWTLSPLAQVMAWHLFSNKPLRLPELQGNLLSFGAGGKSITEILMEISNIYIHENVVCKLWAFWLRGPFY